VGEPEPERPGKFDRDTSVWPVVGAGAQRLFGAEVSPDWRAGRGPHGGYLAAMLLRALIETVDDPARAPRSLTIHYPRAPQAGPVSIRTVIEREGRSLTTLSARMEQDGTLIALVLAAFSTAWSGPEIAEEQMPAVEPPDLSPGAATPMNRAFPAAPPFAGLITLQPRIGGMPFSGEEQPMLVGGWLGMSEPRPIDPLSLAFYSDALIPSPFLRTPAPVPAPTIELTVHFRVAMPREPEPDPHELCLAQVQSTFVHDGLFTEDGTIWAADGTLLAQSRQLAILLAAPIR